QIPKVGGIHDPDPIGGGALLIDGGAAPTTAGITLLTKFSLVEVIPASGPITRPTTTEVSEVAKTTNTLTVFDNANTLDDVFTLYGSGFDVFGPGATQLTLEKRLLSQPSTIRDSFNFQNIGTFNLYTGH